MTVNPSFLKPLKEGVIKVKGTCNARHLSGDTLFISCYDSGGSAASFIMTFFRA